MNLQGAMGKPWIPTLTLENYLNLENVDIISSLALRKILMMHGFNSKVSKNDLLEAVRSIELMDAHHSTLHGDGVSSNALLSLNDVIKDLSFLHWQECCITSLETINSVTDFTSEDESSPNSNTSSGSKDGHKTESQVLKNKSNLTSFSVFDTNDVKEVSKVNPEVRYVYSRRTKNENTFSG